MWEEGCRTSLGLTSRARSHLESSPAESSVLEVQIFKLRRPEVLQGVHFLFYVFDILANWDMMSLKTKNCLFILHSFCKIMVSTYEILHISYIFSTSITNIDHI